MPSYIELNKQPTFPASSSVGNMIFGVNTSNEATLTDSNGTTYNFGTGTTTNPYYQTFEIDLSLGSYIILNTGIYRISKGDSTANNVIQIPEAASFVGGTIVLINNDIDTNQDAYFDNNPVYSVGSNDTVNKIGYPNMFTLYSINSEWRAGRLSPI